MSDSRKSTIFTKSELLQLYDLYGKEEKYFLSEHHSRIHFFVTLLSTIYAATVYGMYETANEPFFIILVFGPILTFFISVLAMIGTFRIYRRFIEAISVKAKLEYELKMNEDRDIKSDHWIIKDSLIPNRYKHSRTKSKSTDEWIKSKTNRGYQRITLIMFIGSILISVSLAIIIILHYFDKISF